MNSILITAPIVSAQEIPSLIDAGADEYYAGFIPPSWGKKYGYSIPLNRREAKAANVSTPSKIKELVREIHKNKKKIYLTFNACAYAGEQIELIKVIIFSVLPAKPDAFIISDLGLMLKMKEWGIKTPIIISSDFGVYNSETLRFLEKASIKIKRIIFPRYLSLKRMKEIIEENRQYEYEAFMMNDRCPYEGAYCFACHITPYDSFCRFSIKTLNKITFLKRKDYEYFKSACENLENYKRRETMSLHPFDNYRKRPNPGCGLCAIKQLKRIGITSLKICGRDQEAESRLKAIKIVKKVINHNIPRQKIIELYCNTYPAWYPQLCQQEYNCCYKGIK